MSAPSVNEPVVNEPVVNDPAAKPRPPLSVAAQLKQAIEHDAPEKVIAAYRAELKTDRAEKALRRVLDAAPPLHPQQVAYLRAVLNEYDEDPS